ncbi:response regulator transcription factor [Chryseobacterium sp. sg2396]|uniref:response regulator n=1 Tax=Chryseobacterium sp. sg2396 TaxID=3276280 RepID=UPI0025F2624D|nr:response regulator transcription factor [uncultured Chryseobacterium sp.]
MDKLRTVIVDDHPIVIEGLKNLLSHEVNLEILEGFCNGTELLGFLKNHRVDLVLLDISLPDISGIDLCLAIKEISESTIVLILSNHTERSIILQAIQNGASGYLLKNSSLHELRDCIAGALEGNICYSREVIEMISRPSRNGYENNLKLTRREKQILALLAEGKTSRMIGEELFLSSLTVDTHRRNLIRKFEVKNLAELIMKAVRAGLM